MRSTRFIALAALALLSGSLVSARAAFGASQSTSSANGSNYIGVVSDYTDPSISGASSITSGPDGALWFTNSDSNSIGRITTSGEVSNYKGTGIDDPTAITAGPDGALWFTNSGNNSIGRISTSGEVSKFTDSSISSPSGITAGSDGALWFTNSGNNSIGRVSTSGDVSNYTGTGIDDPTSITASSDGALWFTNPGNSSIGRITTGGVVSNRATITSLTDIASGPNGEVWFTNGYYVGYLTSITAVGYDEYVNEPTNSLAEGSDDAMWFTNSQNDSIGRVTSNVGNISLSTYSSPTIEDGQAITGGPDGHLWFVNEENDSIARLVVPTLSISPTSGSANQSETISGTGFTPGETVNALYKTGLSNEASVVLCSATATSPNGGFSCTGEIPSKRYAGSEGPHNIVAKGTTSHNKFKVTFGLN